ncbi:MAG TPA: hypothetical protein VMM79_05995 [Longimicrobiales bacterium]|nr:hypothetical protein [Longimicrobiales bacterium]
MDCGRARQLLWPPERPRIADHDVVAAKRHVATCDACRVHFAIDGALGDLRTGLAGAVPRREVRERVFAAVARVRSVARAGRTVDRRSGRRVAVGALVVVAVSGLALVGSRLIDARSSTHTTAAYIEDYVRLAVREDHIVTTDAGEVRRFLLRELGTEISPLEAPGLAITGAEVCLLDGRRGAVIRYRTALGIVTYYLVPVPGIDERRPAAERASINTSTALVTWASAGIERALVGPLPQDSLLELARRAH